jgi:hypothetical protein
MASLFIHWLPPSDVHPSGNTAMTGGIVPASISASSRSTALRPKADTFVHEAPLLENACRK